MAGKAWRWGAVALVAALAAAGAYAALVWWPREQMREAVREHLLDPESARFGQLFRGRADGVICGTVNARNRMGGYAGQTRFVLFPDRDMRFEPTRSEDEYARRLFDVLFEGNCGDASG